MPPEKVPDAAVSTSVVGPRMTVPPPESDRIDWAFEEWNTSSVPSTATFEDAAMLPGPPTPSQADCATVVAPV